AHITSYPVRQGAQEFVSFSGQVDSSGWLDESWSQKGSLDEMLADFEGWHHEVVEMLMNSGTLYKWGIFVREKVLTWTKGSVTLLGDACHSMVPYLGQGVNMAFEDSYILADLLLRQSNT